MDDGRQGPLWWKILLFLLLLYHGLPIVFGITLAKSQGRGQAKSSRPFYLKEKAVTEEFFTAFSIEGG
ncbi:MAG: hypothetical protein Q7J61_04195 [Deltaproteobacteria bacterium]|nr:hypothetical protein [Deltaproteobacteria bacterium]